MNITDLRNAEETLNKKDKTFVDYYASAVVDRFRLRNIQLVKKEMDDNQDYGGPIPALVKHLRRFTLINQDNLTDLNFLKEVAAQQASDNVSKQRFSLTAKIQDNSKKVIVGSWLSNHFVARGAIGKINMASYEGAFLGLDTKKLANEYLLSELTDVYKMAHNHFGKNLPLDREIVVPFGANKIMGKEEHPRSNLGELKIAIERMYNEGIISKNVSEISQEALYQLSNKDFNKDSDVMKVVLSEVDNELSLPKKPKFEDTSNEFGM